MRTISEIRLDLMQVGSRIMDTEGPELVRLYEKQAHLHAELRQVEATRRPLIDKWRK